MPDGSTPARRSEPMVLTARLSQVRIREPGEWRLAAIQSSTLGREGLRASGLGAGFMTRGAAAAAGSAGRNGWR